jgi:hypothetical protein
MNFDLRTPMGAIFTLIGLVLTAFGAATNGKGTIYASSLGIDANLCWGLVLAVFGLVILISTRHGQKPSENAGNGRAKQGKALRER